jgi:DNA-directed RNA polymerase specialized sigma24 family protein
MNAYSDIDQVLTACRNGDSAAIEAFVPAYKPHIYRFALSILRNPVEADEAAQDSLVAAIGKLDTYRREASFKTWLSAITLSATNISLDENGSH